MTQQAQLKEQSWHNTNEGETGISCISFLKLNPWDDEKKDADLPWMQQP